jgi:hypothetical protein
MRKVVLFVQRLPRAPASSYSAGNIRHMRLQATLDPSLVKIREQTQAFLLKAG